MQSEYLLDVLTPLSPLLYEIDPSNFLVFVLKIIKIFDLISMNSFMSLALLVEVETKICKIKVILDVNVFWITIPLEKISQQSVYEAIFLITVDYYEKNISGMIRLNK